MKKSWLWSMFAAAAVALLAGCEAKEVKTVKSGVLGIDKSRTVEQALSAKLEDLKWSKNKTDVSLVIATGKWKGKEITFKKSNDNKFFTVKPGMYVEVVFRMNADGSFALKEYGGKIRDLEAYDGVTDDECGNVRGGFLGLLYN